MPRRIRFFPLRRLRRFLTIYEPELWELMAAMAYASPVALFPYTELARDGAWARYDAYAWLGMCEESGLTRSERRIWRQLCQELGSGQKEGPPS